MTIDRTRSVDHLITFGLLLHQGNPYVPFLSAMLTVSRADRRICRSVVGGKQLEDGGKNIIDVESREDASRNGTTKRRVSEGRSIRRSWRGRAVSLRPGR